MERMAEEEGRQEPIHKHPEIETDEDVETAEKIASEVGLDRERQRLTKSWRRKNRREKCQRAKKKPRSQEAEGLMKHKKEQVTT